LIEELEAIFRPSSTWQVACACCIVDHSVVGLVRRLGEPWRLARTMLLVTFWSVQYSHTKMRFTYWDLYICFS
jgi:hypothetical protein